jgi:hypothetical protein
MSRLIESMGEHVVNTDGVWHRCEWIGDDHHHRAMVLAKTKDSARRHVHEAFGVQIRGIIATVDDTYAPDDTPPLTPETAPIVTSHTPGPWFNFGPIIHHGGCPIAHVVCDQANPDGQRGSDEQRANAKLIAAAPELLAAAIALLGNVGHRDDGSPFADSTNAPGGLVFNIRLLRAAIEKTEWRAP